MAKKGSRKSSGLGIVWAAAALVVVAVAFFVYGVLKPAPKAPAGVETFAPEGQQHVQPPESVSYKTDPPTSGTHYDTWAKPGVFYDEAPPKEQLVHNLEHGNIVIYYDPKAVPPAALDAIKALAQKFRGDWDGVLAVPRTDPENPVVLTAWTKMLKMKTWDQQTAEAFLDAFRGRGPERPVR